MAETNVIHINSNNWQSEVMSSSLPVLVDFWAKWCGPCKVIAPILDELSVELSEKLKIAKVDVDDNRELASQFGIRSIPTLLIIRGGVVQQQMIGAMGKPALKSKLDPFLS